MIKKHKAGSVSHIFETSNEAHYGRQESQLK